MKTIIMIILGVLTILFSCKKQRPKTDCFPNSTTYRQIVNKSATVFKLPNGSFYLVEQGSIDTRLIPCNLPTSYMVHQLAVIISGDAKIQPAQVGPAPGPCCTEDFVITEIKK